MTKHNSTIPKAKSILNIRNLWYCGRKTKFDLPRELHNIIYEHALVELPLWHRRHKSGCPVSAPLRGAERPVFVTNIEQLEKERRPRWYSIADNDYLNDEKITRCRKVCQGREGLGLLRTNKQIYAEANQILWQKNMFCFDDIAEFGAVLESIPETARLSIQRLSILDVHYSQLRWSEERAREAILWKTLLTARDLIELEVPPAYLHSSADALVGLKHLRIARALHLERRGF